MARARPSHPCKQEAVFSTERCYLKQAPQPPAHEVKVSRNLSVSSELCLLNALPGKPEGSQETPVLSLGCIVIQKLDTNTHLLPTAGTELPGDCKQPRPVVNSHYEQKQVDAFNPGPGGMCRKLCKAWGWRKEEGWLHGLLWVASIPTGGGSLDFSCIRHPASFMRIYKAFHNMSQIIISHS